MNLEVLSQLQPTLTLDQVTLRPFRPEDADAWYTYLCDPEVTRLTSYNVQSVAGVRQFVEYYIVGYQEQRACRWVITQHDSDELIGTCGYYWWSAEHSAAEFGYDLARRYWNRGLMTRAVRAVVEWGFEQLAFNRIQATVMVGNVGSTQVLRKNGFQQEGVLRAYKVCRGEPRDFWMFARLAED